MTPTYRGFDTFFAGLQNLGAETVFRPRKRMSSFFLLQRGVQIVLYLFHENQIPRSDSAFFVPLELIFCPRILEPRFFGYWHCCSDYWTHSLTGHIDQTNATGPDVVPDFGHQGEYSAFLYAGEASRLIAAHPPSQPLYLYLPFESVHGPFEAPDSYVSLYNATIQNQKRRTFSGMLSAMDDAVEVVVSAMRKTGLWDDTLVFFNSDVSAVFGANTHTVSHTHTARAATAHQVLWRSLVSHAQNRLGAKCQNGGPLGSANNLPLRGGKFTVSQKYRRARFQTADRRRRALPVCV